MTQISEKIFGVLQQEKSERKKLNLEIKQLQQNVESQTSKGRVSAEVPPLIVQGPEKKTPAQPKPAPRATPSLPSQGAELEAKKPTPVPSRAHSMWDVNDPEPVGGAEVPFVLVEDDDPVTHPQPPKQGGIFQIGQVGVQGGATQPPLVSASNPVFQQIVRNNVPPKFTGRPQDWTNFVQDWERYLRRLSVCVPALNNQIKLELWEGVLDDTSLKFFRMRQKDLG